LNVLRHLRVAGFVMALVCAPAGTLYAERSALKPDRLAQESDLILVGKIRALEVGIERSHVESGFGNYDWAIDLTLKIQTIEKGQYDQSDEIVVRCFRIKSRRSQWEYFTPSGNHPIPDVGAEVRAHLYRQGGLWRVVFPNGLEPVSTQVLLADAAAIPRPTRMAFTYLLPLEVWMGLLGVAVLLLLILRRFRRRHPTQ
jgi:hypothetical protein